MYSKKGRVSSSSPYRTAYRVLETAKKVYPYVYPAVDYYMKSKRPTAKQLSTARRKLRSAKRRPKRPNKLRKQVKQLSKVVSSDTGTHIYRWREAGVIKTDNPKESQFTGADNFEINTVSKLETAMSGLRYYDPSNPSVLLTADGAAGSFHKEFLFKRAYHKLMVRNNYQVPCNCTIYLFKVKESTNITPTTAFANGLADVGNPSISSSLVYPSDSQELMDLYKIEKSITKFLQPGQEMSMISSSKPFDVDPSFNDDHSSSFQKRHQAGCFAVRISGPLGHDILSSGQQGNLQCAADYQMDSVFEIRYAAGADIKTIVVSDNSISSFTNSGVVSNKSVSDNQAYSVA